MGKKILSYEENEFGVSVCCSDNTVYSGDILVGADGAYSRVRKNMFKKLRKRGLISKTQQTESPVPCSVCWLGVAKSQDPEKYECLKEPFVNYSTVVGGNGLGVSHSHYCSISYVLFVCLPKRPSTLLHQKGALLFCVHAWRVGGWRIRRPNDNITLLLMLDCVCAC